MANSKPKQSSLELWEKALRQLRYRYSKRKVDKMIFQIEEKKILGKIEEIKQMLLEKKLQ